MLFQTRGKLPILGELLVFLLPSVASLVVAVMVGAGAGQLSPSFFNQRQFPKAWQPSGMFTYRPERGGCLHADYMLITATSTAALLDVYQ